MRRSRRPVRSTPPWAPRTIPRAPAKDVASFRETGVTMATSANSATTSTRSASEKTRKARKRTRQTPRTPRQQMVRRAAPVPPPQRRSLAVPARYHRQPRRQSPPGAPPPLVRHLQALTSGARLTQACYRCQTQQVILRDSRPQYRTHTWCTRTRMGLPSGRTNGSMTRRGHFHRSSQTRTIWLPWEFQALEGMCRQCHLAMLLCSHCTRKRNWRCISQVQPHSGAPLHTCIQERTPCRPTWPVCGSPHIPRQATRRLTPARRHLRRLSAQRRHMYIRHRRRLLRVWPLHQWKRRISTVWAATRHPRH